MTANLWLSARVWMKMKKKIIFPVLVDGSIHDNFYNAPRAAIKTSKTAYWDSGRLTFNVQTACLDCCEFL